MLYNCEKIVIHIYIADCCSGLKVRIPLNELINQVFLEQLIAHSFYRRNEARFNSFISRYDFYSNFFSVISFSLLINY